MIKRFWRWFVLFNGRIPAATWGMVEAAIEQAVLEQVVEELFDKTKKGKITFEENARRGEENRMNYLWSITHRGWLHDVKPTSPDFASASEYSDEAASEVVARHPELNIIVIPTDEAYRAPMKQPEPSKSYRLTIAEIGGKIEVIAQRDLPDWEAGEVLNKVVDFFMMGAENTVRQ